MMPARSLLIDRLAVDTFPSDQLGSASNIEELRSAEFVARSDAAKYVTNGFLRLEPTGRPASFIRARLDPMLKKRLCQWILKKYPASAPPLCTNCRVNAATQSHVAACYFLLENLAPDIPARFRPEALLSSGTVPPSIIAVSIAAAVRRCLPIFS